MDFVGGVAFKSTYLGFTNIPYLNTVMLGYFKMPFSLEEMPTEENIVFMERSTAGLAFVPGRQTGARFLNQSANKRSTYSMGLFYTNNSDSFGQNISNNLAESVSTRVTFLPYYDENSGGRYYWHFGTSFLAGRPWQGQDKFSARPEVDVYNTTDQNNVPVNTVPNFVSTKTFNAQGNAVLDIENAVVWNSLTLQSEVMVAQADRTVAEGPNCTFWGGYLQASYFLTGEYRPYDRYQGYLSRVYPNERFFTADIRKKGERKIVIGKGAWEVGSRISYLDLNSHDIQGGTLTCYTASLSWNANPHTRFEWNYVHALVNSASFTGNTADIFLTRFIQSF
jgi:phosphate-selective porin OprO/OprP